MAQQRKILVLFAHPVIERSRVNRRLLSCISELEGVTIHDLYELYPDLNIDVRYEQQMVVDHDVIVFQHPLYWYSTPAILKEWQDLVLEHGWAYGEHGHALDGKLFLIAVTTGAPASAYDHDGGDHGSLREILMPLELTARLCRMRYLAPFAVHGSLGLFSDADVEPHGQAYRALLEAIRDGRLDLDKAESAGSLEPDCLAALFTTHDMMKALP